MLKYKIWDKQEQINGVEAHVILESRNDLMNNEVILIHNDNGHVLNIELLEVLKTVLGLPSESTVDEVMQVYLSQLSVGRTPSQQQPSLEEYKEQKIAELENAYQKALQGDFQSIGYTFSYGDEAQKNFTKITALFALKPEKVDTAWNTKSHGIVLLTKEQYLQVVEDAENHEWFELGKLWNYKHKVDVAQSYEEVDAVVWE